MNLLQLRTAFRVDTDDMVAPYLFKDEQFLEWINEAQEEACIRANLIFEAANESMCQVTVGPDDRSYEVDDKWHVITKAYFADDECGPLNLTSREDLDRRRPRWRTDTDAPRELMVFDGRVELDTALLVERVLFLEGYRLPMSAMKSDTSKPEITRSHHRGLIQWCVFRAFGRPDTELYDLQRASVAEAEFTRLFGLRPDADLRRAWFADTPHRNEAFWV